MKRPFPKIPVLILALGLLAGLVFLLLPRHSRSRAARPAALPQATRDQLALRDGQLCWRETLRPFTGTLVEQYESGALRSRSSVSNGWFHGLSEGWHTNGQAQVIEHFRQGVSHGLRTKYYPSGGKLSEAAIVAGQLDGPFRRWHEHGQLAEAIQFADGQPEGLSLSFYPSGAPKARVQTVQGKVVAEQFWSERASEEGATTAGPLAQR